MRGVAEHFLPRAKDMFGDQPRAALATVRAILTSLPPTLRGALSFDRTKITFVRPLRNAFGVFLPLALAALTGNLAVGVAAAIGALQVAFSDRPGPYRQRASIMLAVSLLAALSTVLGGLAGHIPWLLVLLVALWAFWGGLLVMFGPAAEQVGITSMLVLVIYGGLQLSPRNTLFQALFIFLGGLIQLALAILAWPLRQYGPEREALSAVFNRLAAYATEPGAPEGAPPATAEMNAARTVLTGLGSVQGEAGEAFRVLLDEAERIRLELLALRQSETLLQTDSAVRGVLLHAAPLLAALANALATGAPVQDGDALPAGLREAAAEMKRAASQSGRVAGSSILIQSADTLLGELNACLELIDVGRIVEAREDSSLPRVSVRTALREALDTVRANLTLSSAVFRHALRLAAAMTVAEALGNLGLTRAYWIPLTVAIVLKPDFNSTFSRGVLRVAGTILGLAIATGLLEIGLGSDAARITMIGVLVFLIRSVGPANFGLSAVAVTTLVVVLLSFTGIRAHTVIVYRGIDTLLGGALALLAYAVWPTWERRHLPAVIASLLDAYRRYFDVVMAGYLHPGSVDRARLHRDRLEARVARTNAEAALARISFEPGSAAARDLAQSVLDNSHRFATAVMTLEAGLYTPRPAAAPPYLAQFAADVDVTLQEIDAAMRTGTAPGTIPDLRRDQQQLEDAMRSPGEAALLLPVERITNSLKTIEDALRAERHGG